MASSFSDLQLNGWILRQLEALGIREPTGIQLNCIPPILRGQDCIGAAKTGSGKTLAFALPILQKLSEEPYGIFAVVLTPTRELAFQIYDTFSVVGKAMNVRLCVATGGRDMVSQGTELSRQPHVVICTPGRLADHLDSCPTFTLARIKFLVLDEADRLLGGAFDGQIERILRAVPKTRQTLCFSATITDALLTLQQVTRSNQVFQWQQESDTATVDLLRQYYILAPAYVTDGYLVEAMRSFLEEDEHASIIIFTDTCKNCQLLSMTLNKLSFINVPLHGMISQKTRLESLDKFKASKVRILVATDVASRGLDIPEVELVINHNIPSAPKTYIHRVGRTARAGRGGAAVTLISPSEIKLLHQIENVVNVKMKEFKVDAKKVAEIFTQVSVTKREAEIQLDQNDFFERKALHKRVAAISEGKDPDEQNKRHGSFDYSTTLLLKRKKQNKFRKHKKFKT